MGQLITIVAKPSARPGVVRLETNRNLTGMGHERYASAADATGDRPVDEVARRIFAAADVESVHVYGNVITVDLAEGRSGDDLADVVGELFVHYLPGVLPPTDEELTGPAPAAG
jgi:hypothetical protein